MEILILILILMTLALAHMMRVVGRLRDELERKNRLCAELSEGNKVLSLKHQRAQREIRCLENQAYGTQGYVFGVAQSKRGSSVYANQADLVEQNSKLLKQLADARETIAQQKRELHALDARRDAAMRLASGLAEAVDVGIDASAIEIHGD